MAMDIQVVLGVLNLFSQEAQLIDELNNCFKFDQNIFLIDASVDFDNFVRNEYQPQSFFTFDKGDASDAYVNSLSKIRSKNRSHDRCFGKFISRQELEFIGTDQSYATCFYHHENWHVIFQYHFNGPNTRSLSLVQKGVGC